MYKKVHIIIKPIHFHTSHRIKKKILFNTVHRQIRAGQLDDSV